MMGTVATDEKGGSVLFIGVSDVFPGKNNDVVNLKRGLVWFY